MRTESLPGTHTESREPVCQPSTEEAQFAKAIEDAAEQRRYVDRLKNPGPFSGVREALTRAVHTITSPVRDTIDGQIKALGRDGDTATFEIGGEVKIGAGKGFKSQYRNEVVVLQHGGSQADTADTCEAPQYEVRFNKRLLGAVYKQVPNALVTPSGELGARSVDQVSMRFDNKADVARAARSIGDLAAAESLRDIGRAAGPGIGLIPSNPILDERGNWMSEGVIATGLGGLLAPPDADIEFLQDHVTGYATRLDARGRAALDRALGRLGLNARWDNSGGVERRVEYGQDGEAGRVIYSLFGLTELTSKQRYMPDGTPLNLHNRTQHGNAALRLDLIWEFDPQQSAPTVNGRALPELGDRLAGEELRGPDAVELRVETARQDALVASGSHPDQARQRILLRSENPGRDMPGALSGFIRGDLQDAAASLSTGGRVEVINERVQRSGFEVQPEAKLAFRGVGAKANVILRSTSDTIQSRDVTSWDGGR